MKVYGDIKSGNCYKIKLLLSLLDTPHEWVHVDILQGETRSSAFLAKNPNGKIPVLELADGRCLSESNAILNFLAAGTPFLPEDRFELAKVQQWQFLRWHVASGDKKCFVFTQGSSWEEFIINSLSP